MSYYYYQLRQTDEEEDAVFPTGSLRHPNRGSRQSSSCQQYQHYHDNRTYRPRASTDSIPFADADTSSGKLRVGKPLREAGTSSSEETVNRQQSCSNKPRTVPAGTSLRHLRPCPPPPPSPPATFLDSEDATSLNNLLDALDDIDVVEEDRRSSLTTTGSSRDDEEPVVFRNGPSRPTLASILVSIPPPPTPPPPEIDMEHGQVYQCMEKRLGRSVRTTAHHSNPTVKFELPPPPPMPPEMDSARKVSTYSWDKDR
jgi:hypothetical protein